MTRETKQHHLETEQLLRYLDGDLPWRARLAARRHLGGCRPCEARLDEILGVEAELRRLPDAASPADRAAWKAEMRAGLRVRLTEAEQSFPVEYRPGWWSVPQLAFLLMLMVCVALAVVAVRHWSPAPEPKSPPPAPVLSPAVPTATPAPVRPAAPLRVPEPAFSGSREVAVWAALHRLGANLGEPVRVVPEGRAGVAVYCGDLGAQRELEIRTALAAIPGVSLRMESPAPARTPAGALSLTPQPAPLDAQLKASLGGATAFQSLANSAMDAAEQMMAAAHALHNLDSNFASREQRLSAPDQSTLRTIRVELTELVRTHARELLDLLAPVRKALAAQGRTQAGDLFDAARRMDRAVLAVFGGADSRQTPAEAAAELEGAARQLENAAGGRR